MYVIKNGSAYCCKLVFQFVQNSNKNSNQKINWFKIKIENKIKMKMKFY